MPTIKLQSEIYEASQNQIEVIKGFYFGAEPYQLDVQNFLLNRTKEEIEVDKRNGTFTSLFFFHDENHDKITVGYSTIGIGKWVIAPQQNKSPHYHIPYFGITDTGRSISKEKSSDSPFAVQALRFTLDQLSMMVSDHVDSLKLIDEKTPDLEPFYSLYVHEDNAHAIKFYERFGFVRRVLYSEQSKKVRIIKNLIPMTYERH